MKKIKELLNQKNILIILLLSLIVIFLIFVIYAQNYRNFSTIKLRKNNKTIFSIDDLKVGNLKYLSTYDDVINSYAKPKNEEVYEENNFKYKQVDYDGLKLTLKEYYNDYVLVKVEISDKKYITSRKIRVKSKISKVLNSYYIKNSNSRYMYGNYTIKSLKSDEIKENIFFGYREKNKISYINKDAIINNKDSLICKIIYEYKNGKVTKITWSYDIN